ncbi:Uncharacterised protein [Vibrio cholerae]|nr:Uncharacterised protein [Vibrio cholerae]
MQKNHTMTPRKRFRHHFMARILHNLIFIIKPKFMNLSCSFFITTTTVFML